MEGCLVFRTWQDASGPGHLGRRRSSSSSNRTPRSGFGLGYNSPVQESGEARLSLPAGPSPALQPSGHALGAGTPGVGTADWSERPRWTG